jgi:hypothetical protein
VTHGKDAATAAPCEKYPAAPDAAFSPDGPSLFDKDHDGNPEDDPTAVLVGPYAVEYMPTASRERSSKPFTPTAPAEPAKPQRKRKGR